MANNLAPLIEEFRKAYTQLAATLFPAASMPMPVIHVAHKDSRRKGMSWYRPNAWHSGESAVLNILASIGGATADVESLAEIAIAAEGLDRDLNDILIDLLHEMVHHFNFEKGRPDLSKTGYHSRYFLTKAWFVGLDPVERGGYNKQFTPGKAHVTAHSGLRTRPLTEVFDALDIDRSLFDLHRLSTVPAIRPGSKLLKYRCACTNARVATEFKATCLLCGVNFAKAE